MSFQQGWLAYHCQCPLLLVLVERAQLPLDEGAQLSQSWS